VLARPLTIVLPIHNGERRIRSSVLDILDLSHSVTSNLELVIVDDGSTDDTYEAACELARTYPQIKVLRQQRRRGAEAALRKVRAQVPAGLMIVHDGTSAIDSAQLRILFNEELPRQQQGLSESSHRFASVRTVQQGMEQVHKSLTGFRWIRPDKPIVPRRSTGLSVLGLPSLTSTMPSIMLPPQA